MKGPKTGVIRASYAGGALADRRAFSHSHAMLLVSVGQPYHDGEKFESTIALVNRTFGSCTLLAADTLQRHNLHAEHNIVFSRANDNRCNREQAYDMALAAGDAWLMRNKCIIDLLTIPHKIIRWDHYLSDLGYRAQRLKMGEAFEDNKVFKAAVLSSVEEYLYRMQRRYQAEDIDYLCAYENCQAYLLEECTILTLWPKEGFQFEVYPTRRNAAMATTYAQFVEPHHPNLLRPVHLRFKRHTPKTQAPTPVQGAIAAVAATA